MLRWDALNPLLENVSESSPIIVNGVTIRIDLPGETTASLIFNPTFLTEFSGVFSCEETGVGCLSLVTITTGTYIPRIVYKPWEVGGGGLGEIREEVK